MLGSIEGHLARKRFLRYGWSQYLARQKESRFRFRQQYLRRLEWHQLLEREQQLFKNKVHVKVLRYRQRSLTQRICLSPCGPCQCQISPNFLLRAAPLRDIPKNHQVQSRQETSPRGEFHEHRRTVAQQKFSCAVIPFLFPNAGPRRVEFLGVAEKGCQSLADQFGPGHM